MGQMGWLDMNIVPINKINSIDELSKLNVSQKVENSDSNEGGLSFKSIFKDAINDVKETNQALQEEAYKLATGQTDNLHDVTIASTKASLSVDLFIALRNKTLDAYNEIMRMSI